MSRDYLKEKGLRIKDADIVYVVTRIVKEKLPYKMMRIPFTKRVVLWIKDSRPILARCN